MQLLLLSILLPSLALASNATLFPSYSLQRRDACAILPITPTAYNGLTPCGAGGLTDGCVCCPDNLSTCLSPIHKCTLGPGGSYICTDAVGSDCAAQGLADCDNSCMPQGATCCTGQNAYCPSGKHCCTNYDGSNGCCSDDSTTSSDSAPTSTTDGSAQTSSVATAASSILYSPSSPGQVTTTSGVVAATTPGTPQSTSTTGVQSPFQTSIAARTWLHEPNGFVALIGLLCVFFRDW